MNEFDQLVRQHLELQGRVARDPAGINIAEVESLLAATRAAGRQVAAVEQREHLRAILRYWGAFIFEKTSEYPATQLEPYDGQGAESDKKDAVSATLVSSPVPALEEKEPFALETMPPTGTAAEPASRPPAPSSRPTRPAYQTNPLIWVALALVALVLIAFTVLSLLPGESSPPTNEGTTGIPPDVLGPITENGETVIDVTRPPETTTSGVDFILTIQPEATLPDLAAALQTNVATLQALNPTLSSLPFNSTLLALLGQPVADAQLVVTSASAMVFDQPDWQAQTVTNLQSGSFASVLGRTTDYDWYWVNTEQGTGWVAGRDTGLIYPTVPDSLPIIARIQLIPDTAVGNDSDD